MKDAKGNLTKICLSQVSKILKNYKEDYKYPQNKVLIKPIQHNVIIFIK